MSNRPPPYPPLKSRIFLQRQMEDEVRRAGMPLKKPRIPFDGVVVGWVLAVFPIVLLVIDYRMLFPMPKWWIEWCIKTIAINGGGICVWGMLSVARRESRRIRRYVEGQCPDCGYDIRDSKTYCTECGRRLNG